MLSFPARPAPELTVSGGVVPSLTPRGAGLAALLERGVEILYDDRPEKAGFMFNDADLIGAPLRLIVSPKNVAAGQVEFKTRDGKRKEMIDRGKVVEVVMALLGR